MLYLTNLPVNKEDYSVDRILLWAIFGPQMILLIITKSLMWHIYVFIGLPMSLLFMTMFVCFLRKKEPPTWFWFFSLMGVVIALLYNFALIGILLDLMDAFGLVFNLK